MKSKAIKWTVIGVGVLLLIIYLINHAKGYGDFKAFLEASKMLLKGENCYNKWIFLSEGNYCFYYYSPLFALILVPFTFIPPFITNLTWLLANVFFLYRITILLMAYYKNGGLSSKINNFIIVCTFVLCLRFILANFEMIQLTIYLLWSALESLSLIEKKKEFSGSLLLAIAINIKILPVVLIPYLLYRKLVKPALLTVGFLIITLLLPGIFLGLNFNLQLLQEWWNVINPFTQANVFESDLGTHSLTSFIPAFFMKTTGELPVSRNFLDLSPAMVSFLINSFRLCLILLSFYFLKFPVFKKAKSNIHRFWEISYLLLVIPIIFPHQQKYAFVMVMPAVAYIIFFFFYQYYYKKEVYRKVKWWFIRTLFFLFVILTTFTSDAFIGRKMSNYTQHFKLITFGTLLVIVILAICEPGMLREEKEDTDRFIDQNDQ
jgi:hypothetical protein